MSPQSSEWNANKCVEDLPSIGALVLSIGGDRIIFMSKRQMIDIGYAICSTFVVLILLQRFSRLSLTFVQDVLLGLALLGPIYAIENFREKLAAEQIHDLNGRVIAGLFVISVAAGATLILVTWSEPF